MTQNLQIVKIQVNLSLLCVLIIVVISIAGLGDITWSTTYPNRVIIGLGTGRKVKARAIQNKIEFLKWKVNMRKG